MERRNELMDSFLEFYTSKSTSFASFFVGSLFGLFTILSLLRDIALSSISFWLFTISYVIVVGFGGYCMLRWGYYAMLAEKVTREIDQMMKDPLHQPFPPKENFKKWFFGFFHPVRSRLLRVLFLESFT